MPLCAWHLLYKGACKRSFVLTESGQHFCLMGCAGQIRKGSCDPDLWQRLSLFNGAIRDDFRSERCSVRSRNSQQNLKIRERLLMEELLQLF